MFLDPHTGTGFFVGIGIVTFIVAVILALSLALGFIVLLLLAVPAVYGAIRLGQRYPELNWLALAWIAVCLFVWLLIAVF